MSNFGRGFFILFHFDSFYVLLSWDYELSPMSGIKVHVSVSFFTVYSSICSSKSFKRNCSLWVAWLFSSSPPCPVPIWIEDDICISAGAIHPCRNMAHSPESDWPSQTPIRNSTPIQSSPEHVICSWCFHCRRRYSLLLQWNDVFTLDWEKNRLSSCLSLSIDH